MKISWHRNGVGGCPFQVGIVDLPSGKTMLIIQFDDSKMNCAAFDFDLLKKGVIEFGENSWRGDVYSDILWGGVEGQKHEDKEIPSRDEW